MVSLLCVPRVFILSLRRVVFGFAHCAQLSFSNTSTFFLIFFGVDLLFFCYTIRSLFCSNGYPWNSSVKYKVLHCLKFRFRVHALYYLILLHALFNIYHTIYCINIQYLCTFVNMVWSPGIINYIYICCCFFFRFWTAVNVWPLNDAEHN